MPVVLRRKARLEGGAAIREREALDPGLEGLGG